MVTTRCLKKNCEHKSDACVHLVSPISANSHRRSERLSASGSRARAPMAQCPFLTEDAETFAKRPPSICPVTRLGSNDSLRTNSLQNSVADVSEVSALCRELSRATSAGEEATLDFDAGVLVSGAPIESTECPVDVRDAKRQKTTPQRSIAVLVRMACARFSN